MSEARVYDSDLEARSAFDHPFVVVNRLREQGVRCKAVGINGGVISYEYRVEIEPPYEVRRDEAEACWRVYQRTAETATSSTD